MIGGGARAATAAALLLGLAACAGTPPAMVADLWDRRPAAAGGAAAESAAVAPEAGGDAVLAAREDVVLGRRLLGGTAARRPMPSFPGEAPEGAVARARAAADAATRRALAAQHMVELWARGGDGPEAANEPESVRRAQRLLTALGYYAGPVNGVNGPLSGAAIRRFQAIQGAPETGEVTAALLLALRSAL